MARRPGRSTTRGAAPPRRGAARAGRVAPRARLRAAVARKARELGATLVGFAPVERWAEHGEVPEAYRPDAIWARARTVVTFGVPILLPIIDSTPSVNYTEQYNTANRLLDDVGYRLSVWLTARGHASFFLPRDGYGSLELLLERPFAAFSHVMSAKYAGMGTIGLSHCLVTPEYGPRVRLASIFTAAALPGDPVPNEDCCSGCRLCARLCPARALQHREEGLVGEYDKAACTRHHMTLRAERNFPCGICVKVCPIGADREVYGSFTTREYIEERAAVEADADAAPYRGLVHLRRHGSMGGRKA